MTVLFIVNEPTPYFTPDLDALASLIPLEVVYCEDGPAPQGWGRLTLHHPHHVVGNGVGGAFRVLRLLITNDYEAVVSFSFRRLPRLSAFVFARLTRTPLVVRTDSSILDAQQDSAAKRRARRLVMQRFIPRETRIWTIGSNNGRYWMEEFDRLNQYLIPYELRELPARDQGCDRHSDRHKLHVLYVGRLVAAKGVGDLIAAVRLLDGMGLSEWTLTIAGDGPQAEALKSGSDGEARIEFLGAVPYRELATVYRSADVLVLPSRREPWGLVVNEALGFGLRVIASDRVGCAVDLIDVTNGAVYEAGDIQSLARLLIDSLEHTNQEARPAHSDTVALMAQDLRRITESSPL